MTAALRYLLAHSLLNSVLFRLRRLRQPKYLVGAIFGAAYFYFYFYRFLFGGGGGKVGLHGGGPSLVSDAFWPMLGAAILFVATMLLAWVMPDSRAAIAFTEAEIAFLFPAPIARRTLIIHKLLKSQFALLLISLFFTLITGRFRAGSEAWFRMGGWWIILNTLNMHRIGASFALQRLRERGMANWTRRILALLVVAAVALGVEVTRRSLPPLPADPAALAMWLPQLASAGPMQYVLVPFRLVVSPYFTHTLASFLAALWPALGIMALHFICVVRADVSFEEAAIASAQKRATFLAAHRRGEHPLFAGKGKAKTPLWQLGTTGFAPFAFLWKSLLRFGGRRSLALWAIFFTTLAGAAWYLREHVTGKPTTSSITLAAIIGIGCYLSLLFSLITLGQHAAKQLRQGIADMDLLKTYPIPGWQLALGELLGPFLLGAFLQWSALSIGGYLASAFLVKRPDIQQSIWLLSAGLAVLLPMLNIAMAILPSAAALLFPGWLKPQEAATPGIENTGLRLLLGIGQLLAIAIALVPPAFLGGCAWFAIGKWTHHLEWQIAFTAATALPILAMEAALGIAWLGNLYDRYDAT